MAKRKEQYLRQKIATSGHSDKALRGWNRFYQKVAHCERMMLEGKVISTVRHRWDSAPQQIGGRYE